MNAIIEIFVTHCGEMGSRWGFNRTVGQMMGLILATEKPVSALEIAKTLNISRGNVSMSLKELLSWRLIQIEHVPGDRKEYFRAAGDIWELANRVLIERRKREIDPTLALLKTSIETPTQDAASHYAQQKMQEIYDLLALSMQWADDLQSLESAQLKSLMKMGVRVAKFIKVKDNLLKKQQDKKP